MSQAFRRDFILPPLPSSLPPPLLEAYDNTERSPDDRQAIPMILPVIILFFFLVSFFTIYLFRDILYYVSNAWIVHRGVLDPPPQIEEPTEPPTGLNPLILASFPVFPYASIKRLKRKYGLVCAICLSEFSDDDTVRLLTVCNHAFHPECIDTWLASHVTCPVCRRDLEKKPEESNEKEPGEVDGEEEGSSCRISVVEEAEASSTGGSGANEEKPHSYSRRNSRRRGDHGEEEEDEYTLRLPEDVGERLVYLRSASPSRSQSAATSVAKHVDHHSGS